MKTRILFLFCLSFMLTACVCTNSRNSHEEKATPYKVNINIFGGDGETVQVYVDRSMVFENTKLVSNETVGYSAIVPIETSENHISILIKRPKYNAQAEIRISPKKTPNLNVFLGFTHKVIIEDAKKSAPII